MICVVCVFWKITCGRYKRKSYRQWYILYLYVFIYKYLYYVRMYNVVVSLCRIQIISSFLLFSSNYGFQNGTHNKFTAPYVASLNILNWWWIWLALRFTEGSEKYICILVIIMCKVTIKKMTYLIRFMLFLFATILYIWRDENGLCTT